MRGVAELGVPPDPGDVGLQGLSQTIGTLLELFWIIEENEIQSPKHLGHRCIFHSPADDRCEAFIQ